MASVSELLSIYQTTEDLDEAENALDQIAAMEHPSDLELGECYDGLAEAAAEEDDFPLAVRAQRRALEHGCQFPDLAGQMLGWYLLKAGEREEGEAVFVALREERPDDPDLLATLGAARSDSADWEGALGAFEEALELAKKTDNEVLTRRLRAERQECRSELGLSPDDDDHLAERRPFPEATSYAVAWYPRDQIRAVLARWPDLADDLDDSDTYCKAIEARLREVRAATGRAPSVAPLQVEAFLAFASEQELDPSTGDARSRFAAVLGSRGETVLWPPGRNDPCWCGSNRKYKHCCG